MNIPIVPYKESKTLQIAKSLQAPLLLDVSEMQALFDLLGAVYCYRTGTLLKEEEIVITKERFLDTYRSYIEALKQGTMPIANYKLNFALALSKASDALIAAKLDDGRVIARVVKPVIQMQALSVHYSHIDNKFRPMAFGPDSFSWGILFSYPQICQDPETMRILKVEETEDFPNTQLFRLLQKWQRRETIPTPFLVGGEKINVPIRLGKRCLSWVNQHPQLKQLQLSVAV